MSDWPPDVLDLTPFGALSTACIGSPIAEAAANAGAINMSGTNTWPVANLAIYTPVVVRQQVTVYGLGWLNGATVSGNVDAGLYTNELVKVVTLGSTAMSGASVPQITSITSTNLAPGLYYLAMAADNVTATFGRANVSAQLARSSGLAQQSSAFALPTSPTFAAMAQVYEPLVFAAIESSTF